MKLVRFGPMGEEKPGLIDEDGRLRDLSGVIEDIHAATLSDEGLAKLAKRVFKGCDGVFLIELGGLLLAIPFGKIGGAQVKTQSNGQRHGFL